MAEAAQLDPILEENNDMALAVYKPNMTLAEQRKLKNEDLKKKVLMITNQEKLETGSQMSQMSTGSEKITFITGTKTNDKAQKKKKKQTEERPDSPMTRAAKALEMMNGAPDASLASLAVVPAKK